ncbi:MAG TPA: hypothetical protein VLF93_02135 [Candidatus Saccharimonadales bacterium]|nr:hypothetical protein [Candidatus Saccharimonadales bacterium]
MKIGEATRQRIHREEPCVDRSRSASRRWATATIVLGLAPALMVSSCKNPLYDGASTSGSTTHGISRIDQEKDYAASVFGIDRSWDTFRCLDRLWQQESSWDPDAVEDKWIHGQPPTYAYGIPQANPHDYGHPFQLGDWRAQIRWGKGYIDKRYDGELCEAWDHEERYGWY